jgi:DNA-binding winged helix-turn-helix (wHTH) protein
MTTESSPRYAQFGPYEADFHTHELRKYGLKLKVSGQPLQILEMLLAHPGQLITRDALQKQLWPEHVFVDSNHGLNAAVNKLREALGDSAEDPKYIETLPRRGYRFIGTIQVEISHPPVIPTETSGNGIEGEVSATKGRAVANVANTIQPGAKRWVFAAVFASAALLLCSIAVEVLLTKNTGNFGGLLTQGLKRASDLAPARTSQAVDQLSGPNAEDKARRSQFDGKRQSSVLPIETAMHSGPRLRTVVAGDGGNAAPQFSPDGKRIAFMSSRTGAWQIWVSGVDGSHPRQVSFTESAGTPRWSPDGRSIAFDAPSDGETRIFVVRVDANGQERPLVEGLVPSFSRDGKWIYFASDQTADWQVWKVPVSGGSPTQVTFHGGFAALESADGSVYYSKSRYPQPEICRVPVHGGDEICALQRLRPRTWASWAVTRDGIVFAEDLPNGQSSLSLYDPSRRQVRDLVALQSAPFWVGATADGKRAMVNDASERQISMVENLR